MSEPVPARHTLRTALLISLAVLGISLSLWMTAPPSPPAGPAPTIAGGPVPPANSLPVVQGIGGDFRLPASSGGELSLSGLRGKVVLLNFGFTNCPDVCPTTLTRLGNVLRVLQNREGIDMSRVQPLFITFDPERDSLDHLREFVTYFHPALVGLRGDLDQTAAVAKQYKVLYLKQDTGSASGYVFQHSDFVYVIDTYGRVRLLVGSKDPDAALVESVKRLLSEGGQVP